MKFEKTTLVEFNVTSERERLSVAFKGKVRTTLLAMLARFEAGEFEALAEERLVWPREFAEFVHPVIDSTLRQIIQRQQIRAGYPEGRSAASSDERLSTVLDLQGISMSKDGLPYPKFRLV